MFGKLIKNELKTGLHSIMGIYIAVLVAGGLMSLTFLSDKDISKILGELSSLALIVIGLIALVITICSTLINFQKSLYGSQGYLTFTLPTRAGTLFASKVISSFFWIFVSYLIFLATIVIFMWYSDRTLGDETQQLADILLSTFGAPTVKVIARGVASWLITAYISLMTFVTIVMFSITLGNTRAFQKHSAITALVATGAILVAMMAISNKVVDVQFGLYMVNTAERIYFSLEKPVGNTLSLNVSGTIFHVIIMIGLFFGTSSLMKRKISVK